MNLERRIKELEKRIGASEPIVINIHTTTIGMDGEVKEVEERVIIGTLKAQAGK